MRLKRLTCSLALVLALTALARAEIIAGDLLIQYKNLLLIKESGNEERVILIPEAVSFRNFKSLTELESGSRLKLTTVREIAGVTVSNSLELEPGIEPF